MTDPLVIDCDAVPSIPTFGWRVPLEHQLPNRVRGTLTWDPDSFDLYLSPRQRGPRYPDGDTRFIKGMDLRAELEQQRVVPASVLDLLLCRCADDLKFNDQVYECWRGWRVYFWGTIYSASNGLLYVRSLDLSQPTNQVLEGCRDLESPFVNWDSSLVLL